jgi:hypothetical protein
MQKTGADIHEIKKDHQSKQSLIGSPTNISSSSSIKRQGRKRQNERKI